MILGSHADGRKTVELRAVKAEIKASRPNVSEVVEAQFWYNSASGQKRIEYKDNAVIVLVPRLDYNETVTGTWAFQPASGAPFTTNSTVLVTNLNSDRVDGYHASEGADASTLAARDANARITAADPTATQHVVTLGYMQAYVAGIRDPKDACRVATTAALPANTRTNNVLTASANGAFPAIDGITLALNDRILVKNESTGANNGLYYLSAVGDASNPWSLTRTTDADASAEVTNGLQVWITEGTTNNGSGWLLDTDDPITLNTTALTFIQVNGTAQIIQGNGIVKSGNTIHAIRSANYDTNAIIFAASTTTLSMSSNLTWNGSTLTVTGGLTTTGTTTLATTLTGLLKGASGVVSAITGTANRMTWWSDANTIAAGASLWTDGTNLAVGGTAQLGTSALSVYGGITTNGAQTIQSSSGILTVTGTGGMTLSTSANTNIALSPNGTGAVVATTARVGLFVPENTISGIGSVDAHNVESTSFSFSTTATVLSDVVVESSAAWRIIFIGLWGNNQGFGQTAAPHLEITAVNNTLAVGNRTLTVTRNGSGKLEAVSSADTIFFKGTLIVISRGSGTGTGIDDSSDSMLLRNGLALDGDITLNSGGTISTTSNGHITLSPNGNGDVLPGADNTIDLGASGTRWATIFGTNVTVSTNLTVSSLTAGRVVIVGASGLLADDADLTFAADTLTATKVLAPTSVSTPSLISTTSLTVTPASGSGVSFVLATTGDFSVNTNQFVVDTSASRIGIGTTTPSYDVSIGGNAARTIGMERHTTANTAGNVLTVQAGGATSGATDKAGGTIDYIPGISTGTGGSKHQWYTSTPGTTGTTDNSPTVKMDLADRGLLRVRVTGIGASGSDNYGFAVANESAAAAGAQQYSPAIRWRGAGWKTDATAASQTVDFRAYVVPVQGAANPTGYWTLERSINGAAYSEVFRVDHNGLITVATINSGSVNNSHFVTSVSGTTNRITSSGGLTPTIDISASYVGQTSITTLGTISTGTWQATVIGVAYGGTGLASYATNDLIYASAATTLARLASVASKVLTTNGSGVIAWSSDLPAGITIGGKDAALIVDGTITGDGSSTALDYTHGLGRKARIVGVRKQSSDELVLVDWKPKAGSTTTIVTCTFAEAPANGEVFEISVAA